jgi:hypothetical protein
MQTALDSSKCHASRTYMYPLSSTNLRVINLPKALYDGIRADRNPSNVGLDSDL